MKPFVFPDGAVEAIADRVKAGESSEAIAATYGCDRKVILRLVRKHRLGPWKSAKFIPEQQARAMPEDFAVLAATMTNAQLVQHYRCGGSSPSLWRRQLGLAANPQRKGGANKRPTPPDFATYAPGKTVEHLSLHYGLGTETIRRMRADHGIVSVRPAAASKLRSVNNAYMTTPTTRVQRDMTLAGQACDYLRRYGPVWRCSERGGPSVNGPFWRRGSAILTDAELIERAEAMGWDRGAWMRVKAA